MARVLILSRTPIGARVSSPGIRYQNMARVLRQALPEARVDLAAPRGDEPSALGVITYENRAVVPLARGYDVVIAMSFPVSLCLAAPFFRRPLLVLDFFSEFHFEWMESGRDSYAGLRRRLWTAAGNLYVNLQLQMADFVICANDRQRDAYLGVLAALGRLTPATYAADSTLRRLIDVVPHGVRPDPLPERRNVVKGVFPGIEAGDKLLLWLGGILYWYDPITLLRALARVRRTHPELKLLFLGSVYPGGTGEGARYHETVAEAKRLGLWQTGVFVQEEWLPHEAVVDYLLEADVAVTTYFTNAETRFAYRTRFLDYIWANLPIVCTRGDVLADAVAAKGWGIAVAERDEDGLVAALTRLVEDDAFAATCRANLAAAAKEMTWEAAFEPLRRFLARPGRPAAIGPPRSRRVWPILRSALAYLAARGAEKAASRL